MRDIIRTCRFNPYIKGKGPVFTLHLIYQGTDTLGYELKLNGKVLFVGKDFRPSPLRSIDSDSAVRDIMGFLTCAPGDTDDEYFDKYTPEQLEYCKSHAEALSCEVSSRYPDE